MARPRTRHVPWLDKRPGSDQWYAFYYDPQSKRVASTSMRTSDIAEAQTRFAAFLVEGRELFTAVSAEGAYTAGEALRAYLVEHTSKCASPERQEYATRPLLKHFGDTPLRAIDIPASRAYAAMRKTGAYGTRKRASNATVTDSTIRRELNVLIAAANHAARWRRITPAELPSIELPLENREEAGWLTRSEVARLIREAKRSDERLHRFVLLLYYTGARRDSIERLTPAQVDLKNRRIYLALPGEKRTVKRRPIIPIDPMIRSLLATMVASQKLERDKAFFPADPYRAFVRLCERAGLPAGKRHPHILRHSRATHLLHAGKGIYDVARLIGDTVQTVERTYGHHSPEGLEKALF